MVNVAASGLLLEPHKGPFLVKKITTFLVCVRYALIIWPEHRNMPTNIVGSLIQ